MKANTASASVSTEPTRDLDATCDKCQPFPKYPYPIVLCPLHAAAPAMYEALIVCRKLLANSRMGGQNRPEQAAYEKVVAALASITTE